MMFGKGRYQTVKGHQVIIVRVIPVCGQWMLRGAVEMDGVWHFNDWHMDGQAFTGHPDMVLR